jgi:SPP1 family predicted phage head-tail adaptor
MQAGPLARHRFTWQRPDATAASGYADVATVHGALRTATGSESIRFGAPTSVVNHVIEIRYRSDIRASWRATDVSSGRVFQVVNYGDPDDRRRRLLVFCAEIQ